MSRVINILGSQVTLGSATNVGFAKLVRVLNNKTTVQLITKKNAGGTTIGTVTLAANEVAYIQKSSTDTLAGAATSLAVSIAF